ncbi:MAG: ABC transporter permease subunit [Oscillospiraceae bacterium]|nr:ABC transporter permease subunit [Oscillospiraceae bacterium]
MVASTVNPRRARTLAHIRRDRWLYLLALPGLLYFLVFKYLPMWGVVIAFKDYVPFLGVLGSKWVGLKWFRYFFSNPIFTRLFGNTILLSLMNIVFFFPAPIILALMLNELRSARYKKAMQTLLYIPHFVSIVIVCSITYVMFNTNGIVYKMTYALTGHSVGFLTSPSAFRPMIIGQTIWKETGWGTIIFLAALAGVDVELYEAAMCDGAGRLRQLWHVTLPAIRSTIVLLLVLRMGSVLDTGYEHLILMANAMNRSVSQTFDVFVYQQGIQGGQYSYATAIGLFKAVISVALVTSSNAMAHRMGEPGLY